MKLNPVKTFESNSPNRPLWQFNIFGNNIIESYLFRTLINTTIFVLMLILSIYVFINLINNLSDYSFIRATLITLLSSFESVYDMSKPVILLGIIVGLSLLKANYELVAMSSIGLKNKQIAKVVVQVAIIFSLLVYFLGEVINPFAQKYISDLKQVKQVKLTSSGLWLKNDQGIVRISKNLGNQLKDVYIYKLKDNKLIQIKIVKKAKIIKQKWNLKLVSEQNFIYKDHSLIGIKKSKWDEINSKDWLSENIFNQLEIKIYAVGIKAIWDRISFLRANGINNNIYWLNLFKRVFTIIDSILVALFAMVLILYPPVRSQKTGSRIIIGLMIGLGIYLFSEMISQTVLIYNFNPITANVLMVVVLISVLLIFRWIYGRAT